MMQTPVEEIFEAVDAYAVALTLFDPNYILKMDYSDYNIYDGWDYDNPPCHSIIIKNDREGISFKFSRNTRDGELILFITDNNEQHRQLLYQVYNQFKDTLRKESGISVHFQENEHSKRFQFEGYFWQHDNYVLDVVRNYIKKTWRDLA